MSEREFLLEARQILTALDGEATFKVQKEHLEALEELYECKLIRIANMPGVDQLAVLEMP